MYPIFVSMHTIVGITMIEQVKPTYTTHLGNEECAVEVLSIVVVDGLFYIDST